MRSEFFEDGDDFDLDVIEGGVFEVVHCAAPMLGARRTTSGGALALLTVDGQWANVYRTYHSGREIRLPLSYCENTTQSAISTTLVARIMLV